MGSQKFENFDPEVEEFGTYIERLEQHFIVSQVKEEIKAAVLITAIGRKTYGVLRNLLLPDNPKDKTYLELVTVLKLHYAPVKITIAERFKFHKRGQHAGETLSNFIVTLRQLASTCDFGPFLNDALRDAFVCGMRNESIQNRLLSEPSLTFDQACKIALGMEMAGKETRCLHSGTSIRAQSLEAEECEQLSNKALAVNRVPSFSGSSRNPRIPVSPPEKPAYSSGTSKDGTTKCGRCGSTRHHESSCPAKGWKCFACRQPGHTARMCRKSSKIAKAEADPVGTVTDVTVAHPQHSASFPVLEVTTIQTLGPSREPLFADIFVNDKSLRMEVDTGAGVSIIPVTLYRRNFGKTPLAVSNVKLKSVAGEAIGVLGELLVSVKSSKSHQHHLPLVVAEGISTALLGRDWLSILVPNWKNLLLERVNPTGTEHLQDPGPVHSVDNRDTPFVTALRQQFPTVFDGEASGKIRGFQASIHVKDGAKPIFMKAYPVPYALLDKVETELNKLVAQGIIVPVTTSDWASPIVVVPKADSSRIRLCVDFKRTLNQVVTTEHYPLPRIEDILASLSKGKIYSVLDLANAYQQLEVAMESRELLTINTHKGLYQFTRLPFGVTCAPAIFQRVMDSVLKGIPNAICYLDDVLIYGACEAELKETVIQVMERLAGHNIKINVDKCHFLQTSVEYLGHTVSDKGIRPSAKNFEAIQNAPVPSNITQLRSYLGLLNFYSKFIPNLACELKPLYDLLKSQTPWSWTDQCESSFERSKKLLQGYNILTPFDPTKPLYLACDASAYGIGAVLFHLDVGGERPILFASSTLSTAEQGYAQIEREALALIFGVRRFHKYLYGREFTLITDHQPLEFLFGEKKGIPTMAAARIQRWAIILSSYQYQIQYRKGKELVVADTLSRLPLPTSHVSPVCSFTSYEELPVTAIDVARATSSDPILSQARNFTLHGWPQALPSAVLKPYWSRRTELSVEEGCLVWGSRVILPAEMRLRVLKSLHGGHPGIVRMKMKARSFVWWPGLDNDIESTASECVSCQLNQASPPKTVGTWPTPLVAFERIHTDLAQIEGVRVLILADSYSKWVDVYPVATTGSQIVMEKIRNSIACHGLPQVLVADNGPPFSSSEFRMFCSNNGIKLQHTPVYHPSSNGLAERAVRTVKDALKKQLMDHPSTDVQTLVDEVLFQYRNTPCTTTGKTPSELIFAFKPRVHLDLLKPTRSLDREVPAEASTSRSHRRTFQPGDSVLVKSTRGRNLKWMPGRVLEIKSPLTYLVTVRGKTRFVHLDHLRPTSISSEKL